MQLKLKNNSKDIITEVTLNISCKDSSGKIIEIKKFTYTGLFASFGMEFGTDVAIPLEYMNTDSIDIEIEHQYSSIQANSKKIHKTGKSDQYNILFNIISIVILIVPICLYAGILLGFHHITMRIMWDWYQLFFPYVLIQVTLSEKNKYGIIRNINIIFIILALIILFLPTIIIYKIDFIIWGGLLFLLVWNKKWIEVGIIGVIFVIYWTSPIYINNLFSIPLFEVIISGLSVVRNLLRYIVSLIGFYHLFKRKFKVY